MKVRESPNEVAVWPETVIGGKYVRLLEGLLHQLRGEDSHGNRRLFLDDVFVAYLLAFFNPTIRSLRTIEDFSESVQAQKHMSVRKICRSTLSDFNQLANPERLTPILAALRAKLATVPSTARNVSEGELPSLLRQAVAVDGTFLAATADVTWALAAHNQGRIKRTRARLDVQLSTETWLPEMMVVAPAGMSESNHAALHVESGKLYLYDRGFSGFKLLDAHYRDEGKQRIPHAHFVARYRKAGGNSPTLVDGRDRPLTAADRQAGIVSDRVGYFGGLAKVPLREVLVEFESEGKIKTLRLITNLLDVSAATIAQLYRYRWQIELFFRWLKCYARFDHLISHTREGVLTHFYVTVIAVLLMYLHTGHRPSKYLFALMSQVASGGTTFDNVLPILRERERQCEVARQSAARRLAKKRQSGS
jgi:Transposase DDE domain